MIGCCSEAASTSFDELMLAAIVDRLAGPGRHKNRECLVEHLAPRSIIDLLPRLGNSPANWSPPRPTPRMRRPPLSRSSVAVSLATLAGRRRASGMTWAQHHLSGRDRERRPGLHGSASSFISCAPSDWCRAGSMSASYRRERGDRVERSAAQPNVRICRESRASPRPSRRRNRLRDTSHRS